MGRPARRKSLVEHPGDALLGRSVVADGSIFHQSPTQKFPGKVTGRPKARKDRVHVIFEGDDTEYWFPIDLVKTWLVDGGSADKTAAAATPGSAAAKLASAQRRRSGLSLLGWGRAADASPPAQHGSLTHRVSTALSPPGWPAVSAAHVGWGAGRMTCYGFLLAVLL
ncbi:hypothetical protein WJX81_001317 [Elliptochloris bilobata]|uniref:Uncharacterized protein n=1 Tax=Elliptochloris bilobata TaxID=381761 RepID=A0AAW1SDM3_9CHLO